PALEGVPVERAFAGPVSAWADAIADEAQAEGAAAARPARPARRVKGRGDPTMSDRSVPLRPAPEKPIKTARGTSMGGRGTAKERAGAGLMPIAGMDTSLEDAESLPQSAV